MCSPHDEISMKLVAAATDEILIMAAKSGDRTAFVELWTRHSKIAFNMAWSDHGRKPRKTRKTWFRTRAEGPILHLNTFDGRSKFSTWLTRIAINSALDSTKEACSP